MHCTKIFGPPGTGKTFRLLQIMESELARGVAPERLAYLTFTVAARQEAKDRAITKFGFTAAQLKWFRTLHSVAYELLGINSEALVTQYQGLPDFARDYNYEFSQQAGNFTLEGLPTFGFNSADRLMAFDHFRRHRMQDWETAFKQWDDREIKKFETQRFCDGYERWKAGEGWVDFTDLLERGSAPLPCDVVIVDEAQDLSPLQWKAFWVFAQNATRVYLAGDDDQAIYEWAGAAPEVFLAQPANTQEVLLQSHRCPRTVTTFARNLIEHVKVRQAKNWQPRDVDGAVLHIGSVTRMTIPDTGSVRILYRNHKYSADVLEVMHSLGEPYMLGNRPSIEPIAALAIVTWEDLRKGKAVTREGLEAIFATASLRRVSQAARDCVRQLEGNDDITTAVLIASKCWTSQIFDVPWFALLDRLKEQEFYLRKVVQKYGRRGLISTPRILLNTIHSVKGAEADHVILLTQMSRLVLRSLDFNPDAERRVWYVGLTRARETLQLIGMDNPLF